METPVPGVTLPRRSPEGDARRSSSILPEANSRISSRGRPHDRSKYVDAIAAAPARELARTSFSRDASEPVRGHLSARIGFANSSHVGGRANTHLQMTDKIDRLENNDAHLVIDCRSLSGSRRSMPRWPPSTSSFRFNRPLRARRNRSSARCDREAPGGRRTRLSCGLGDPLRPCAALAPAEGDARHSSSISPQGNSSNLSRGLPHERSQHGRGGRRSGVRARSTRDQWATRSSG